MKMTDNIMTRNHFRTNYFFGFLLILFFLNLAFQGHASHSDIPSVEFRVKMSQAVKSGIFDPDSDAVYLIVDQGFLPVHMAKGTDHIYSAILDFGIDSGTVYQFHFRINDNLNESVSRTVMSNGGTQIVTNWWNDDPANRTTFLVDMQFAAASGQFDPLQDSVYMLGTMNKWSGDEAMARVGNTLQYTATYVLDPGVTHRYKYRINSDSSGLELVGKPDRIFRVPDTLLTLSNDFNNVNPGKMSLTLRCNMKYYITTNRFDPLVDYVDVSGNFNDENSSDVLFDRLRDSVYMIEKWLDTTWIQQGPLAFRFRINGRTGIIELQGKPDRVYTFHDTTGLNPNIYSCYFNNLDPTVPTPPWVTGVAIQGAPVYKKILSGSYSYENVNGIAEGLTKYQWFRSDNAEGLNAIAIDSATSINYVVDTVDIGYWLVFEVTPKAVSGDSAMGEPVRAVTATRISGWDVGLTENTSLNFTIFPNPASDYVNFRCAQPVACIEIISLTGQVCMKLRGSELSLASPISIVSLPPGFYLVRLTGNDHSSGVGRLLVR